MPKPPEPGTISIGSYVVHAGGEGFSVARRPGPCQRLGLRKHRPILSLTRSVAGIQATVSQRALRGSESKRPWTARPYRVQITGADGEPLCRALGFRRREDAERLAGLVTSTFAGRAAARD